MAYINGNEINDAIIVRAIGEIADGSVTTAKLANGAVNAEKIAPATLNAINNKLFKFVAELPTSSIDENAFYFVANNKMFPDANDYVTSTYQKLAVTYDDGIGYRLIRFATDSDTFYTTGGAKSEIYQIYTTDGTSWELADEGEGTGWATAMSWTTSATGAAYTNVIYANTDFRYIAAYKHWDTANNTANIHGVPTDTSLLNPYEQLTYRCVNNEWVNCGLSDFSKLFESIESKYTALESRVTALES